MSIFHDEIVMTTRAWLGTPYRHQASVLGAGCDCLGLLRGVWRTLYGDEPEVPPPYRAEWRDLTNAGALQQAAERYLQPRDDTPFVGAVLLFRMHRSLPAKHCGIMVSSHSFVHAQEQIGVVEANLTHSWARRVSGVFQFPARTII